jgi:hypothetical protein
MDNPRFSPPSPGAKVKEEYTKQHTRRGRPLWPSRQLTGDRRPEHNDYSEQNERDLMPMHTGAPTARIETSGS